MYVYFDVFVCLFACILIMCMCPPPAVCLFGGRELVEGDLKAVRDSSGRCLLFDCKVSHVNKHIHIQRKYTHLLIQNDLFFIVICRKSYHNN